MHKWSRSFQSASQTCWTIRMMKNGNKQFSICPKGRVLLFEDSFLINEILFFKSNLLCKAYI